MKVARGLHTKPNIWDQAKKLKMPGIDAGVKFFVFALNALGLPTEYSCEGHPGGFYVIFRGPYEAALEINKRGFLSVEVEGRNRWAIRINMSEGRRRHVDHLRHAARVWETNLLPKKAVEYLWSL